MNKQEIVIEARNQIVKDFRECEGLFEPNLDRAIGSAIDRTMEQTARQLETLAKDCYSLFKEELLDPMERGMWLATSWRIRDAIKPQSESPQMVEKSVPSG